MIRFSASLVVIALGLLVAGGVTSKLLLVYVAIAVSAIALILLITGAILNRGEFRARPSGETAGPAAGTVPGPWPGEMRRTPRPGLLPWPARRLPALLWPAGLGPPAARLRPRTRPRRRAPENHPGPIHLRPPDPIGGLPSSVSPTGAARTFRGPATGPVHPVGPAGRVSPAAMAAGPRSSGLAGDCRTKSSCTLPGRVRTGPQASAGRSRARGRRGRPISLRRISARRISARRISARRISARRLRRRPRSAGSPRIDQENPAPRKPACRTCPGNGRPSARKPMRSRNRSPRRPPSRRPRRSLGPGPRRSSRRWPTR